MVGPAVASIPRAVPVREPGRVVRPSSVPSGCRVVSLAILASVYRWRSVAPAHSSTARSREVVSRLPRLPAPSKVEISIVSIVSAVPWAETATPSGTSSHGGMGCMGCPNSLTAPPAISIVEGVRRLSRVISCVRPLHEGVYPVVSAIVVFSPIIPGCRPRPSRSRSPPRGRDARQAGHVRVIPLQVEAVDGRRPGVVVVVTAGMESVRAALPVEVGVVIAPCVVAVVVVQASASG